MQTIASIRADFDRVAQLQEAAWDHNIHYHSYLLKLRPDNCETALEIGCGTGAFSRLLADSAQHVLALDISPRMIEEAKRRSRDYQNVEFLNADFMAMKLPVEEFDFIVSIATLHHLPAAEALTKIRNALKPGGRFVSLDLYETNGPRDLFLAGLAFAASPALTWLKTGQVRQAKAVREAYAAHGKTDTYLKLSDVMKLSSRVLPGVEVKQHLFWRYSISWTKPTGGTGRTCKT